MKQQFKVGDHVRITNKGNKAGWNNEGHMHELIGKTGVISEDTYAGFYIKGDTTPPRYHTLLGHNKEKYLDRWLWNYDDLELVEDKTDNLPTPINYLEPNSLMS